MKVARFTESGRTRLGVVTGDHVVDVGHADPACPTTSAPCSRSAGCRASPIWRRARRSIALADVVLEAPIAQPPTFLAIGLNYADHVAESGMPKPDRPVVFNKQITCVTGPSGRDRSADRRARLGRLRGRARRGDRAALPQRQGGRRAPTSSPGTSSSTTCRCAIGSARRRR